MSQMTRLILPALAVLMLGIDGSQAMQCEVARAKCAFREGCGFSLRSYMIECSGLIAGYTNQCNERCERALVALVSTDEGADLVNCDCNGNKFCMKTKERIEVCRSSVYSATAVDAIVSCNTARWICMADPVCSTALDYYQLFCKDLVTGRGCSHRCNNSLSILNRQEKAAKLRTCYCDGTEEFPCQKLKYNTERFCYGRKPVEPIVIVEPGNAIDRPASTDYPYSPYGRRRSGNGHKKKKEPHFYDKFLPSSSNLHSSSICSLLFGMLSLVFVANIL